MKIIYYAGYIDAASFKTACIDQGLDPQKVVFLFPGNSGHHGRNITLFSIKGGGGLAAASADIGRKGYPTLSLPTTSMEQWSKNLTQQQIVAGAIADVYRAIGAGYSLMLPIREHSNTSYFDSGLQYSDGLAEPSFWGENQKIPNKPLANYYTTELDKLHAFMALADDEKLQLASTDSSNPFYAAYLQGRQMHSDDPWLQPPGARPKIIISTPPQPLPRSRLVEDGRRDMERILPALQEEPVREIAPAPRRMAVIRKETAKQSSAHKPEPKATQLHAETVHPQHSVSFFKATTLSAPASYHQLYQTSKDPLQSARALLNDYTKGNSWWLRFFTGHWNRHHIQEVAQIVKKMDDGIIKDKHSLLTELNKIHLVNINGSLARRIQFIERKFAEEDVAHQHHSTPAL
ncbi:DUF5617 domain-containing protein [Legionella oakridgensis]|uniref:RavJ-like C-terminal domain-containing protein n=2 Tax=Legionella oakridgensis TaxID=29423 RepID=W0BH84_9GAMM|nr:DUF5617 domain-containing protein [Legionella oakridgensis]AHE67749.1 hypothetical protein Loa_02207 [Legionella oakridgensis ATCC 33761 = DSM 21215]KTD36923.1 leucine-rich repeat-containing protein [Legionella oakridgensis]STY20768.1 Dot/Icm secretion system substrate [Legionella longbeachae]